MIWKLKDLFEHNCAAEINGKWVPARPLNYKHRTLRERLREAWLVFKGKAEAFTWPEGQ